MSIPPFNDDPVLDDNGQPPQRQTWTWENQPKDVTDVFNESTYREDPFPHRTTRLIAMFISNIYAQVATDGDTK